MTAFERPPGPTIGKITHHTIELSWDAAINRANERMGQKVMSLTGDARVRVLLEQKNKGGAWTAAYTGYGKVHIIEDLDAWETYYFRLRFSLKNLQSEWSQEITVTTAKNPLTGVDIHSAITRQNVSDLQRILETKEAPVDAFDKFGFSPLMQAAQKGYVEMIEILMDNGANVNMDNDAGKTPLMLAAFHGQLAAVKELRYHGALYESRDKGGSTALHWAVDGLKKELIEWMIEDGADVRVTDTHGWTPLHRVGAVGGNKDVASILIRHGADVNTRDKDGKTILMMAVINGHQALVELLLDNKADITAQNEHGKTAYDMAMSMDKLKIVKVLEEFMSKNGIKNHH